MRRLFRLLAVCLAAGVLGGCAGYRLGPTNGAAAGGKSIQVNPFANQTLEPRLGDAVTAALRKSVAGDGTCRLATHGAADIVVGGVITKYDRHELSLLPSDVLTVSDFRVNMTAQVTARETATGREIFNREMKGYTLVRVGSDLTSAERQAIPLLAEDLAKNVTALLVDGSW
jgi:hypothetical protein